MNPDSRKAVHVDCFHIYSQLKRLDDRTKMVTNIQKVSQLAYKVFSRFSGKSGVQISKQNVEQISSLMNTIGHLDANFDISKISTTTDAPVSYMDIFEDPVMTMAIFIIRDGCRIPLHDHPDMYGFCKVIHGSASLKCYSDPKNFESSPPEDVLRNAKRFLRHSVKPVVLESDSCVTAEDKCCVITPEFGTYHEIVAVNGPVAFLDILAPSYDHVTGLRTCQYYEEIQEQSSATQYQGKHVKWLAPISQPRDFWCNEENYEGPSVLENLKVHS